METTQAEYRTVPLAQLVESPTNPRKHFDAAKLAELADSIRTQGVLEPLLVRAKGKAFEIVVGARRYRAAKLADQVDVPVRVVQLTDDQVLEVQVIENLQREDVHPLEEASGFKALLGQKGYHVEKIAARIGRSVKYVYDRVKLLQLTKDAQQLFLEGRLEAGHAVILARLKPEDQARAIGRPDFSGPLWRGENLLFNPDEEEPDQDEGADVRAISVRELQAWVDEHVRFPHDQPADPMLFPETALTLESARKIIPITHQHHVDPDAKAPTGRTWGPRSWKRADGTRGGKKCDRSVTGVITVGPGRGDAFEVCVDRDRCAVHWGSEQKAKASSGGGTSRAAEQERYRKEEARRNAEEAQRQAEMQRWKKAAPTIVKAIAEKVRKAPAGATSHLADLIIDRIDPAAAKIVPRGKSAEDLVRCLAFQRLCRAAWNEYWGLRELPKLAKPLGIDVQKILDEAAPKAPPPAAVKKPAKAKAGKKRGRATAAA